MIRLNIGCNNLVLNGWNNMDIIKYHPAVHVHDIRNGLPYVDNGVDEIYTGNFIDHLDPFEGERFLVEVKRVLKQGGILRLSALDYDKVLNAYLTSQLDQYNNFQPIQYQSASKQLKFSFILLGNLSGQKEYTGHKMLYNTQSIYETLRKSGFKEIAFLFPPLPEQEPWILENKLYYSHCLYAEIRKS